MAEESKQSGLVNDESKTDRSIDNVSLDDSLSNLEEYLDFDIYNEDISIIADEANYDSPEINRMIPLKQFTLLIQVLLHRILFLLI